MPGLADAIDRLIEVDAAVRLRRSLAAPRRGLAYDREARRYRRGRRALTHRQLVRRRDALADAYAARFGALAARYAAGSIGRGAFEGGFLDLVGAAALAGYAFGRGGPGEMDDGDRATVAAIVAGQADHARRFFADVRAAVAAGLLRAGEAPVAEIALPGRALGRGIAATVGDVLSAMGAQIAARARLYAGAVVAAFERGRAAAHGVELPEYPGDRCLGQSNCRCSWDVRETPEATEATWVTGGAGPCAVCADNAERYDPYRVPKGDPGGTPA